MGKKNGGSLGDRMKEYERCFKRTLPKRLPVVVRVDLRSGHTLTRHMKKPFDDDFNECMTAVLSALCKEVSLCKFGYSQSDEASIVCYSVTPNTEPWFDNDLQKVVSISASIATLAFNAKFVELFGPGDKRASKTIFDARAFVLPEHEVENYFVWRQQDAVRNSIEGLGRAYFSHGELFGVNTDQVQEKLFTEKGVNWNDERTKYKRGFVCKKHEVTVATDFGTATRSKWTIDDEPPVFTAEREYVTEAVFG